MNHSILFGFVGSNPIAMNSKTGKEVIKFSLAVDSFYNGEKKTDWYQIFVWEDFLKKMCDRITKGSFVSVIGNLVHPHAYLKDGTPKVSLTVKCKWLIVNPTTNKKEEKYDQIIEYF